MIRRPRPSRVRWALLALVPLAPLACGGSDSTPTGIDVELVAGTYDLTTLRFDPQGSLPDTNVLPVLDQSNVQLILTTNRTAQVVFQDPITNIFTTVQGTFRTTADGARIEFASNSLYAQLLLSRRMDFTLTGTVLAFDGAAPDGVSRTRLVQLVPALEGEQLLDPTPGQLRVSFTRR
jgi:hypothetical protein